MARKTISHGLLVDANYTWIKAITDTNTLRSGWLNQKAQTTNPAGALNVTFAYQLPFGKNHNLLGGDRIFEAIASGWSLTGVTTYRSGTPFGPIAASCNLPNAGTCYAGFAPGFTGAVRINGNYGSGNLIGGTVTKFLNANAFVSPAPYTYGNTPPIGIYGLRNPASYNQDVSLRREFPLHERLTLRVQMDALNVFNNVIFSGPNTNITSAAFGAITSQANTPRIVQFNARIMF
jgi:hypothetical protein